MRRLSARARTSTVPEPRPWTADRRDHLDETARLLAAVERWVHAFSHLDPASLRAGIDPAQGPLAGMPFAVSQTIDVAGMPGPDGRAASRDAEAVARLRAAGARVLGLTTSTPYGCGTATRTDNPRGSGYTPGGSAAGAGAAVGAGIVPVALATQSQAATLRAASYCGAWGFKPSHLRLPREGALVLSDTLTDLGLVAASLEDLARVLPVLTRWREADPEPTDEEGRRRPLRVGRVMLDDGALPRPRTLAHFDTLLHELGTRTAQAGPTGPAIEVVENTTELLALDRAVRHSTRVCLDILAAQSGPQLTAALAAGESDPRLHELVERAAVVGPSGLVEALDQRRALTRAYAALADHVDVLITLSTTNPAPEQREGTGCRRMPTTASLLGVPALSAPWLVVDGLPQGVQVLGFAGRDEELLAAVRLLAAAVPGPSTRRASPP
ncbi:amidase family protein [Nocardioides campestrisoli]|uniref:amidase family protein n=1 Tax=Nocardioides campestrisoli TaxID=2736757 RepID=UPI0015E6C040|nr:amidase family protein [Nocardioides campestrisoli]